MANKKLLKMMDDIIADMERKDPETLFNDLYAGSPSFRQECERLENLDKELKKRTEKDPMQAIEEVAGKLRRKIIDKFNLTSNTKIVEQALKVLGGKVITSRNKEYYNYSLSHIVIHSEESFSFRLDAFDSPIRDNFTKARAIGAFLLYDGDRKETQVSMQNIQCNRFAAAFLMPKHEFIRQREILDDNVSLLAAYFEIPTDFVEKRMEYVN